MIAVYSVKIIGPEPEPEQCKLMVESKILKVALGFKDQISKTKDARLEIEDQ